MNKFGLIIVIIVIVLILGGSAGVSKAINFSNGPIAEGEADYQRQLAENSSLITQDNLATSLQNRQNDQTIFLQSANAYIFRSKLIQIAWGIGGSLSILSGLLVLVISLNTALTIKNIKSLIKPVKTNDRDGTFTIKDIFNPKALFIGHRLNPHGGIYLEAGKPPQLIEGNATETGMQTAGWESAAKTFAKKSAGNAQISFPPMPNAGPVPISTHFLEAGDCNE